MNTPEGPLAPSQPEVPSPQSLDLVGDAPELAGSFPPSVEIIDVLYAHGPHIPNDEASRAAAIAWHQQLAPAVAGCDRIGLEIASNTNPENVQARFDTVNQAIGA